MVKLSADSGLVHFINGFERLLYFFSILVVTPLLVFALLFILLPGALIIRNRLDDKKLIKKTHILVFQTTQSVYSRFVKVDRSAKVPRFIIFDYIAPISFTYLILYTGIMIVINMFYMFWAVALSSVKEEIPCDNSSPPNITDCVKLSIDINGGISAATSLFLSIVLVYTLTLKILLKVSGGKQSCQSLTGGDKCSKNLFWRVALTISVQLFFIFVAKFVFIAYWGKSNFDPAFIPFNRANAYTFSLLIDVVCFALLTPWCYFEKIEPKEEEQATEMESLDTYKKIDETSVNN